MTTNFVGTVFGVFNTIGMSPGAYIPYVVGVVLDHGSDLVTQWHIVFYATSILIMISATTFLVLVRAEREPWDKIDDMHKIVEQDECQSRDQDDNVQWDA